MCAIPSLYSTLMASNIQTRLHNGEHDVYKASRYRCKVARPAPDGLPRDEAMTEHRTAEAAADDVVKTTKSAAIRDRGCLGWLSHAEDPQLTPSKGSYISSSTPGSPGPTDVLTIQSICTTPQAHTSTHRS
jgi:hypothetical protein